MSQPDDCMDDVMLPMDRDVERLVRGQLPEDERYMPVVEVISTLRAFRIATPTPERITAVAVAAAAAVRVDRSEPARRRSTLSVLIPRLAAAMLAVVLVGGISSVAIAADGSAPGETLYGLDLALERVGIGAGGVDERILESAQLISAGRSEQAILHLDNSVAHAAEAADPETADRVELHLNLAENMSHPQAAETQEHVAAIRQFIEENRGKGVGVDGSEFGQGVSENNPGHSDDEPSSKGPIDQGGGRDNQGPGQNSGRGNGND
jgi:hypothetical protein